MSDEVAENNYDASLSSNICTIPLSVFPDINHKAYKNIRGTLYAIFPDRKKI